MEQLKARLMGLVQELEEEKHDCVMQRLDDLVSVYPFNEYEFLISSLMGYGKISVDEYYELRDDYIARNMFMFESAPRVLIDKIRDAFERQKVSGGVQ